MQKKGSVSESKQGHDDKVSLHAGDDSELTGDLNSILGTNKESNNEDSDSGLRIEKLGKDEEMGEKFNKDLAYIVNKAWHNPNAFEKSKAETKPYKKPPELARMNECSGLQQWSGIAKRIWGLWSVYAICEVTINLINL